MNSELLFGRIFFPMKKENLKRDYKFKESNKCVWLKAVVMMDNTI